MKKQGRVCRREIGRGWVPLILTFLVIILFPIGNKAADDRTDERIEFARRVFDLLPPQYAHLPPSSAEELCARRHDPSYFRGLLLFRENRPGVKNQGGIRFWIPGSGKKGGVCWWHSRFTRKATHLTYYSPEKKRPRKEELELLFERIRDGESLVEVPGFRNLQELTTGERGDVLISVLEHWQRSEIPRHLLNLTFLEGSAESDPEDLEDQIEALYERVQSSDEIPYQMLRYPSLLDTVHSWLVADVREIRPPMGQQAQGVSNLGYRIHAVDSNSSSLKVFSYRPGQRSLVTKKGTAFGIVDQEQDELDRLWETLDRECREIEDQSPLEIEEALAHLEEEENANRIRESDRFALDPLIAHLEQNREDESNEIAASLLVEIAEEMARLSSHGREAIFERLEENNDLDAVQNAIAVALQNAAVYDIVLELKALRITVPELKYPPQQRWLRAFRSFEVGVGLATYHDRLWAYLEEYLEREGVLTIPEFVRLVDLTEIEDPSSEQKETKGERLLSLSKEPDSLRPGVRAAVVNTVMEENTEHTSEQETTDDDLARIRLVRDVLRVFSPEELVSFFSSESKDQVDPKWLWNFEDILSQKIKAGAEITEEHFLIALFAQFPEDNRLQSLLSIVRHLKLTPALAQVLIRYLNHPHSRVRKLALRSLHDLARELTHNPLPVEEEPLMSALRVLQKDSDPTTRQLVAQVLAHFTNAEKESTRAILVPLLYDKRASVQTAAARTLAERELLTPFEVMEIAIPIAIDANGTRDASLARTLFSQLKPETADHLSLGEIENQIQHAHSNDSADDALAFALWGYRQKLDRSGEEVLERVREDDKIQDDEIQIVFRLIDLCHDHQNDFIAQLARENLVALGTALIFSGERRISTLQDASAAIEHASTPTEQTIAISLYRSHLENLEPHFDNTLKPDHVVTPPKLLNLTKSLHPRVASEAKLTLTLSLEVNFTITFFKRFLSKTLQSLERKLEGKNPILPTTSTPVYNLRRYIERHRDSLSKKDSAKKDLKRLKSSGERSTRARLRKIETLTPYSWIREEARRTLELIDEL